MNWPQIVWIALASAGLLIASNEHGKPKTGKHNFWISLIGISITAFILHAGGFFG